MLKYLILDVEIIITNLFQVGIMTASREILNEIETITDKCKKYNLYILSDNLNDLSALLKKEKNNENLLKVTDKILYIIKCLDILKNKINYDELGGY